MKNIIVKILADADNVTMIAKFDGGFFGVVVSRDEWVKYWREDKEATTETCNAFINDPIFETDKDINATSPCDSVEEVINEINEMMGA